MSAQTQGNEFFIPNSSQKRDDVQLLEAGPNPGILYNIIDLGTHYNNYFQKSSRLIKLVFEFPLLKQLFKVDDTEERPTVVSQEYSYILGENSNLKKFIDGAENRILQPAEYKNGWNIGQYLDKVFIVNIINKPSKKDPSIIYNNIGSVQGLSDSLRTRYAFNWEEVVRTNDLVSFAIDPDGKCFTTETFARLPKYYRDTIMKSDEAIRYANTGGRFATYEEFNNANANQQQAPKPVQRKAAAPSSPSKPTIKMLVNDYTYEEYKASGWTDQQLIDNGYMILVQPEAPKAPPSAPQSAPKAPAPSQQPTNLDVVEEDDDLPF